MLESVVTWLTDLIFRLGYPGITILMAIESSFIPFPSEVVLPPAGFLAAQGRMNAWAALAAGLLGSLIGAFVNYYLAAYLGRPFLHRYSRYVLVKEKKLDQAEAFFRRHGEISTFIGRLIPVIRQLISLPAGLARMRLDLFGFYTGLGAGIWCAILTYAGWYVGDRQLVRSLDTLLTSPEFQSYSNRVLAVLVPALIVILAAYVGWYRRRQRGRDEVAGQGGNG